MTIKTYAGMDWKLPYHGRFGANIQYTLGRILRHPEGMALYAAMELRGTAARYKGKYEAAFARFAEQNTDKLQAGKVGPRGGFGYRLREDA